MQAEINNQAMITNFAICIVVFFLSFSQNVFSNEDNTFKQSAFPKVCVDLLSQLNVTPEIEGVTSFQQSYALPSISEYRHGGRRFSRRVKSQCSYGSCWAATAIQVPENAAFQRGVDIELSLDFLIAAKLISTFGDQIAQYASSPESKDEKQYVIQGGSQIRAFDTMRKFGFIPSVAWKQKRHFGANSQHDFRFMNSLKALQARFYSEVDRLKKTYKLLVGVNTQDVDSKNLSPSSGLFSPNTIDQKREMYIKTLELKDDKNIPKNFNNLEIVTNLKNEYNSLAWTLIVSYLGEPPSEFFWKGKKFSPLSFSRLPVFDSNIWTNKNQILYNTMNVPNDNSFLIIRELIDNGQVVPISLKDSPGFRDNIGFYSVAAFNIGGISPEEYVEMTSETNLSGTHSLQIVDYLETSEGEKWLLLKSSWGKNAGVDGYFHVDWESFKYLFNSIYLLQSQLNRWVSSN